ncbi:MAG: 50S ribosomal protein L9 [Deltaproteobacteria bacterium]|nr:50S ribosomal protein L9 [Deltaproteobacteria bacterium]
MAQNVPVILARDVGNLGRIGELVNVRPGYARNYLVPNGLALPASPKRVAFFEHQKKVVEHKRRLLRAESEKRAEQIKGITVTVSAKAGESGKLFGSVTNRDISKALIAIGQNIHHKDIKLAEAIRTVGTFEVDVRLEADVGSKIKVIVAPIIEAEPAPVPEEVVAAKPEAAAEAKPEGEAKPA